MVLKDKDRPEGEQKPNRGPMKAYKQIAMKQCFLISTLFFPLLTDKDFRWEMYFEMRQQRGGVKVCAELQSSVSAWCYTVPSSQN